MYENSYYDHQMVLYYWTRTTHEFGSFKYIIKLFSKQNINKFYISKKTTNPQLFATGFKHCPSICHVH